MIRRGNVKINNISSMYNQGRRNKNFKGGQRKKQDRKIAPLSLFLLYQYHA